MRILEGPAELRKMGLTVREVAGWQTRGNEFPTRPDGVLRHWDAIASTLPTAGLQAITNGRTTPTPLTGPLSEAYQSRYVDANGLDIIYFVASGKANHAGEGEWNGIRGNYKLLGLEIAWSGPSETFGPMRVLTSELVMRGLLNCCSGTNPDDAAEHREYALPEGRKIDTNLDGNVLRRRMHELAGGVPPAPTPGDDDMADQIVWYQDKDGGGHAYRVVGIHGTYLGGDGLALCKQLNIPEANAGKPFGANWQDTVILVDGPCRNTPNDVDVPALVKAVIKALPATPETVTVDAIVKGVLGALPASQNGGGVSKADVMQVLKDSGLLGLLPGQ